MLSSIKKQPLKPLVFMDNHGKPELDIFLKNNLRSFKDAGYGILFLELNYDLTFNQFSRFNHIISTSLDLPQDIRQNAFHKQNLLDEAKKLGFSIYFADSQTFEEADRMSQKAYNNFSLPHERTGFLMSETNKRSKSMAYNLVSCYARYNNILHRDSAGPGIIAIAGFMHREFPVTIERFLPQSTTIVFGDRSKATIIDECSPEERVWSEVLHGITNYYSSAIIVLHPSRYHDEQAFENFRTDIPFSKEERTIAADEELTTSASYLQEVYPKMTFKWNTITHRLSGEVSLDPEVVRAIFKRGVPIQPLLLKPQGHQLALRFSGINLEANARKIQAWGRKKTC